MRLGWRNLQSALRTVMLIAYDVQVRLAISTESSKCLQCGCVQSDEICSWHCEQQCAYDVRLANSTEICLTREIRVKDVTGKLTKSATGTVEDVDCIQCQATQTVLKCLTREIILIN